MNGSLNPSEPVGLRRFLAHEYVGSKLMDMGLPYAPRIRTYTLLIEATVQLMNILIHMTLLRMPMSISLHSIYGRG